MKLIDVRFCHIVDEGCRIVINSLLSQHNKSSSSKFELNLEGNGITDASSSLIASLLSSNYPITNLNVGWNQLSSSTDVIFKSLNQNNILTELLLLGTSLTLPDMQSLGKLLACNSTLTFMDISVNDIGADDITNWRNILLKRLLMSECNLGVSGARKIGEILQYNTSITDVDLGGNSIGDKGVVLLVEYMMSNKTVRHLGL